MTVLSRDLSSNFKVTHSPYILLFIKIYLRVWKEKIAIQILIKDILSQKGLKLILTHLYHVENSKFEAPSTENIEEQIELLLPWRIFVQD